MSKIARAICLVCGNRALRPLFSIKEEGFLHGNPKHNYTYSYSTITVCIKCVHGQLEMFSHDCWGYHGDEDWDMYWWYALEPADVIGIRNLSNSCPNSWDPGCTCFIHNTLRQCCEKLYGGVRSVMFPWEKASFAWLSLEVYENKPVLKVNESKEIEQAA